MSLNPQTAELVRKARKLTTSPVIELFELDATSLGGSLIYFVSATGENDEHIIYNSITYTPAAIQVTGYELSGKGELPRPIMTIVNMMGVMSGLVEEFDDLIGARLTRRRVFAENLDEGAEPSTMVKFPEDIFTIERKRREDRLMIEFELVSALDLDGVRLPRRQVTANTCMFRYRGTECGFAGTKCVASLNDTPIDTTQNYLEEWSPDTIYYRGDTVWYYADVNQSIKGLSYCRSDDTSGASKHPSNPLYWLRDQCGRRMNSCKLRFDSDGENLALPFGAYPGSNRVSF